MKLMLIGGVAVAAGFAIAQPGHGVTADPQVVVKVPMEDVELRVTYHTGALEARNAAATLNHLFSTKNIAITAEATDDAVTVVAKSQHHKMVIDILSSVTPRQVKLDAFQ